MLESYKLAHLQPGDRVIICHGEDNIQWAEELLGYRDSWVVIGFEDVESTAWHHLSVIPILCPVILWIADKEVMSQVIKKMFVETTCRHFFICNSIRDPMDIMATQETGKYMTMQDTVDFLINTTIYCDEEGVDYRHE